MDIHLKLSHNDKEFIRECAVRAGFDVCGFAIAEPVEDWATTIYESWIASGRHHSMSYMERYRDVRNDPRLLLENARSIITVALNYYPQSFQPTGNPQFAYYAYGNDYHKVMKKRLVNLSHLLAERFGGKYRACVDTAPLRERYWAQKSGIGFVGRNNNLIIPNLGSYFFLGFLITTIEIEPDAPCKLNCCGCNRCVILCPGKALDGKGNLDARKCHSCLTIEHRGDLPAELRLNNRIYGCDACQKVCPHNSNAKPTREEAFTPIPGLFELDAQKIANLTEEEFEAMFSKSAVERVSLQQLKRNLDKL